MSKWTVLWCAFAFIIGQWVGATRSHSAKTVKPVETLYWAQQQDTTRKIASSASVDDHFTPEFVPGANAVQPDANSLSTIALINSSRSFRKAEQNFREQVLYKHVAVALNRTPEQETEITNLIDKLTGGTTQHFVAEKRFTVGGRVIDTLFEATAYPSEKRGDLKYDGTEIKADSASLLSIYIFAFIDDSSQNQTSSSGLGKWGIAYKKDDQWVEVVETYDNPTLAPFFSALVFHSPVNSGPFEYLDSETNSWVTEGSLDWRRLEEDEFVIWQNQVDARRGITYSK